MQGGRASLWGLVPPADMKAEEVDDATPKMLTGSASGKKDGAKYTLLVEWKTNKVAKVKSYGSFGLGVEFKQLV